MSTPPALTTTIVATETVTPNDANIGWDVLLLVRTYYTPPGQVKNRLRTTRTKYPVPRVDEEAFRLGPLSLDLEFYDFVLQRMEGQLRRL